MKWSHLVVTGNIGLFMTPNVFVHRVLVCLVLNRGCYGTIKWDLSQVSLDNLNLSAHSLLSSFFFSTQLRLSLSKILALSKIFEKKIRKYLHPPTTMSTLVCVAVWKSGASPDTSHRNLPLVVRSTLRSTSRVSVDLYSCKNISCS